MNTYGRRLTCSWLKTVFFYLWHRCCTHSVCLARAPDSLCYNDNQRIELVNWCILNFINFIFSRSPSLLLSLSLARLCVCVWARAMRFSVALSIMFEGAIEGKRMLGERVRISQSECMQWEHAINVNMIWSTNTRSYQTKCVYNWNDLPKMHGHRAHVKIRLQATKQTSGCMCVCDCRAYRRCGWELNAGSAKACVSVYLFTCVYMNYDLLAPFFFSWPN